MRRAWWGAVVAAGFVAVVQPLLPPGGSTPVYFSLSGLALAVLVLLARRRARPAPWWSLVAGFGLWSAGDAAWSVEAATGAAPVASVVLYLLGYPALVVALVLFSRSAGLSPARRRAAVLEGLAVAVALGLLGCVLLLGPALAEHDGDGWSPVAYVVGDVVLASQAAYLLASSGRVSAARWLGAAATGYLLLNDTAWIVAHAADPSSTLFGTSGLVPLLLWTASALHPDAVSDRRPRRRGRTADDGLPTARTTLLVGSLALPPLLLAVLVLVPTRVTPSGAVYDADSWQGLVLALGGVVLAVLAVLRVLVATSEEQRLRLALQHRADHDPLTGLASRERALTSIATALVGRSGTGTALLFIDLDGFKAVNDEHGHLVGDEVLREVAQRLTGQVRPHDVVARYGGDEFLVVLPEVHDDDVALATADRLVGAVAAPLDCAGRRLAVGASIGLVVHRCSDPPCDVDGLLQAADAAAYRAKAAGRGRVVLHRPGCDETTPVAASRG